MTGPAGELHNAEAEKAVLGAILLDAATMLPLCQDQGLKSELLYEERNRMVWDAILICSTKSRGVDSITVCEELTCSGKIPQIGEQYLDQLVDACVTTAHTEYYLEILKERALRRSLSALGQYILNGAKTAESPSQVLADVESKILTLNHAGVVSESTKADAAITIENRWKMALEQGTVGVTSCFNAVTELLGGYAEYTIVAGRPATGKSIKMLNEAMHSALSGVQVAIASLEMTKEQCLARMACDHANVNLFTLDTGQAEEWQIQQGVKAIREISALSTLHITDRPHTPETLCSWARRMKMKHDIQILWIDYLQLLTPSRNYASGNDRVQDFSRSLLMLRKELGIPVVALCQLSRASENRKSKVPQLSDLRDSGAIEQDAHTVVLLYKKPKDDNTVIVDVVKNRNGPLGRRELIPVFNRQRFEDPKPLPPPEPKVQKCLKI